MASAQKPVSSDNSRESFNDFVADLSVHSGLNDGAVRGSAIGRYLGISGEGPTAAADQHILTMAARTPARFEKAGIGNNWVSYVKSPGALCFVPAGVQFVMRARSDFEMVACALDLALVNGIDAELDHRPAGELRLRTNFNDPASQQLLKLLLSDGAGEGPAARLYSDHLIHALAYRVLVFGRDVSPSNATRPASGLLQSRPLEPGTHG